MYQLLTKIVGIEYRLYQPLKNAFLYQTKQNNDFYIFIFDLINNKSILLLKSSIGFDKAQELDNCILLKNGWDGSLFCFDKNKEAFIQNEINKFSGYMYSQPNKIRLAVYQDEESGKCSYGVFDIQKFNLLWLLPHYMGRLNIVSEYLFGYDGGKLNYINILDGSLIWQTILPNRNILNLYVVSDNILTISYETKPHHFGLCGVDVYTGKVVWDIQPQGFYPYTAQVYPNCSHLISICTSNLTLNGVELWAGKNTFLEINAVGEIVRCGTLLVLDDLGLRIKDFVLQEDKIYFTAHYKGSFGAITVGILDYQTLSLLWWEEVNLASDTDWMGHFLVQLQVSENKMYALDDAGTLHIYERDENVPFLKPAESGLVAFEALPTEPEVSNLPTESTDNQSFNGADDLPF